MLLNPLPIDAIQTQLEQNLKAAPGLFISAPTGTGKSTRVPIFASGSLRGKIIVLQPRRLAAIALASRISEELNLPIGEKVGYQVRGKQETKPSTQIIFQTYGWFFAWLQKNPVLTNIDCLVLDEFHERQVEMDLIWLWLRYLAERNFALPKIILMSATLDVIEFPSEIRNWPHLKVDSPLFPIETIYMPAQNFSRLEDQLLSAAKMWVSKYGSGSCLCFLPGWREINQAKNILERTKGFENITIEPLHGSMNLKDQHRVCSPSPKPRIILATNIAETSLTIPDVNTVIDSGWAREIFYQPDKKINSLKLSRISLYNAQQRKGRCGRTGPGTCFRLWNSVVEEKWAQSISSQLNKVEWSNALLILLDMLAKLGEKAALGNFEKLPWLSNPEPSLLKASIEILRSQGSIEDSGIPNAQGLWISTLPIHPSLGKLLYLSFGSGRYNIDAAMCAILEGNNKPSNTAYNLESLARHFMSSANKKEFSQENYIWKRLLDAKNKHPHAGIKPRVQNMQTNPWLNLFANRLGVKAEGTSRYRMPGNMVGEIKSAIVQDLPTYIIAIDYQETVQVEQKYGLILHWLEVPEEDIKKLSISKGHSKIQFNWINKSEKISVEKAYYYKDLLLYAEKIPEKNWPKNELSQYMAQLMLENKIASPLENPDFQVFLSKHKLAREAFTEYQIPELNHQDFELMFAEWAEGKTSQRQLELGQLIEIFKDYVGREIWSFIEKEFPDKKNLPSGRSAKFQYFLNAPPEISARIADFYDCQGEYFLAQKKIPVLYNILAPNYRTVQKTYNISDFWDNTYPEVKKELRRRYPKHKWI